MKLLKFLQIMKEILVCGLKLNEFFNKVKEKSR